MLTEETTIKITATFNEDRTHRYSLKRTWDESKPNACIIMSNASNADVARGDLTQLLVQNNLHLLGYGGVTIVNLFSRRCQKLSLSKDIDIATLTNPDNEGHILQCVKDSDITVLAIGTLAQTYAKARIYQDRLYALLRECQDKIHVIAAPDGTEGLHPLSGKLRADGSWELVPFKIPEPPKVEQEKKEDTPKKDKSKKSNKPDPKVIPLAVSS